MDKQDRRRGYSSAYLRRTYSDGDKIKDEAVANRSALPEHVMDWIDAGLKGQLVPVTEAVAFTRSLPRDHVAAVAAIAAKLGLPGLLAVWFGWSAVVKFVGVAFGELGVRRHVRCHA